MLKNEIGNVTSPNRLKLDESTNNALFADSLEQAKKATEGVDITGELLYGKKKIRKMANSMLFAILLMAHTGVTANAKAPIWGILGPLCETLTYSYLIDRFSKKTAIVICAIEVFIFSWAITGEGIAGDTVPFAVTINFILWLSVSLAFGIWFYRRRKFDFEALFNKKR